MVGEFSADAPAGLLPSQLAAAPERDPAEHALVVEDCGDPVTRVGEGYAGYAVLPRPVRVPLPDDED